MKPARNHVNPLLHFTALALVFSAACLGSTANPSELRPTRIRDFTSLGLLQSESTELWAAGVERNSARTKVRPFLERIRGGKRTHQTLPSQLQGREIQAFWSGQFNSKKGVATLSQWVIEQGDAPQLHFIPIGAKTAFKLAQAPCVDVEKIALSKEAILFHCAPEEGARSAPAPARIPLPAELKLEGVPTEAVAIPIRKLRHATLGEAILPNLPGEENRLEWIAPGGKKPRIVRPLTRD